MISVVVTFIPLWKNDKDARTDYVYEYIYDNVFIKTFCPLNKPGIVWIDQVLN